MFWHLLHALACGYVYIRRAIKILAFSPGISGGSHLRFFHVAFRAAALGRFVAVVIIGSLWFFMCQKASVIVFTVVDGVALAVIVVVDVV